MVEIDTASNLYESSWRFLNWMHGRVVEEARGDTVRESDTAPRNRFWLGRLAPEAAVMNSPLGRRAETLDPCAVGIRLRPARPGPWRATASVRFCCWQEQPDGVYKKSPVISATWPIEIGADGSLSDSGEARLASQIAALGLVGRAAEVRVDHEGWRGHDELVIYLVNTSEESSKGGQSDTHLYEAVLEISEIETEPFELESLPDSFRYDRSIPAIGINCGVDAADGRFTTTDTIESDKYRPSFWNHTTRQPDFTFDTLATDPLPSVVSMIASLRAWGEERWSDETLSGRAATWTEEMREEAEAARKSFWKEVDRLEKGLAALKLDKNLLTAFMAASAAIRHAANGSYDSWRPFQIGFLVSALPGIVDHTDSGSVDTVWFATGGGKTETYLGLLVTAILYDRLTGKQSGITAWTRFPLRMLSLQQTQRFADALAGAELERRRRKIGGAPISLGFFVGRSGTPNSISPDPQPGDPSPVDRTMPARFQVLLRCPFCRSDALEMKFERITWTLEHTCTNEACPWTYRALPFYVVDQEIFRFLPSVVVGTLDKAASISRQAAMRGFFGAPVGLCSKERHGYTYAVRTKAPTGCLVPGCAAPVKRVPMPAEKWAPRFRLQDELHLLRDSLGAVDSHYESLLDHLQEKLGGTRAKIVASSATLNGFDRQVAVLYRRTARVFPQPGPALDTSFWSQPSEQPGRRYVAVAPRGVTMEFVSDRALTTLQSCVRELVEDPAPVCEKLGIPSAHVDHLVSQYGVNLVYGNTVRDVEAARRSAETEFPFSVNAESLTGGTLFEDVRRTLERLAKPEADFSDRIHLVAASSMISHGVDVERFNVMMMKGLPLTTAEFIQTSARVGRTWPGIVYVLHRMTREREVATYSHFDKFVSQGDRFVEPIPITRRSRRVLALTVVGAAEARRLALHEPAGGGQLTTVKRLKDYYQSAPITADAEAEALIEALGLDGQLDDLLRQDVKEWTSAFFDNLLDPATQARFPDQLSPSGEPMTSLRDVEDQVPVVGKD